MFRTYQRSWNHLYSKVTRVLTCRTAKVLLFLIIVCKNKFKILLGGKMIVDNIVQERDVNASGSQIGDN